MVGLAKACTGGGGLANYVMNESKGYELDRNLLCGINPKEIIEEMKMIQDLNQNAVNKTFSMVLSPDIKDGKNLSDDELKNITQEYLNKLGIDTEKQQYVAFVHTEKEHKHIHIIANRVQPNGKLISDNHIGKRSQWIAHEIAKERGLVSAKEKMFEKIKNIDKSKDDLKAEIYTKHQAVMKDNPQSFENYIKQMNSKGLEVKPTINKQGQVQGFRVRDLKTDKDFKMSEIHRSMSAGNLIKSGLKNDLDNKLDTSLKRIKTKQTSKKTIGQKLAITLKKELKNEIKEVKNIGSFQLQSAGKSLLKTFVKMPKMSREDYKKELKFRDGVNDTKMATRLNEMTEYWEAKNNAEPTPENKDQEHQKEEQSQKEERNNLRDLEI